MTKKGKKEEKNGLLLNVCTNSNLAQGADKKKWQINRFKVTCEIAILSGKTYAPASQCCTFYFWRLPIGQSFLFLMIDMSLMTFLILDPFFPFQLISSREVLNIRPLEKANICL